MRSFKLANSTILFILLTIFIFALAGTSMADCTITQSCGEQTVTLLAGQKIDAGTVTVENDDSCLCITYQTTGDWLLTEVHFHIATSLAGIPQTKTGNPIPGKFKYSMEFNPPVNSYKRCFALEELGLTTGQTVYIAAHAVVVKLDGMGNIIQKETGWGKGDPFPGKNWAMYFTYTIKPCYPSPPPPPVETCETAFAYGDTYAKCFIDYGFGNWGWTNGPLGTGNYTFDIYAAAGQCVLSKGTKVGTLYIDYSNSAVNVTYNMDNGYKLYETHLYVGTDMFPKIKKGKTYEYTVAPGQYPYKHENLGGVSTDTYTINASGNIYVIAHAVVCGVFTKNSSMAPPAPKQSEMAASLWGKIKSQY